MPAKPAYLDCYSLAHAALLLSSLALGLSLGCVSTRQARRMAWVCHESVSSPPVPAPQPLSAFDVKFVPAGPESFPPTTITEVERYRKVYHWPGTPDLTEGGGQPRRPYKVIGRLEFPLRWYRPEDITALLNAHVPRVGGDAVLHYEAFQQCKSLPRDPGTALYTYESMTAEVIRYTDR